MHVPIRFLRCAARLRYNGHMAEPYPYACPWCGDWPEDGNRTGKYCTPCEAERQRQYRGRQRQARLSRWFAEVGTADAVRAAILVSAIVDELGGYNRTARQIAGVLKELQASGRSPVEAARCHRVLLQLMRLALPAE